MAEKIANQIKTFWCESLGVNGVMVNFTYEDDGSEGQIVVPLSFITEIRGVQGRS